MAFSSDNSGGPMADINVTPLVDVMLVLLIIFIITAPLMSHKVKIELPEANLVQDKDKEAPKTPPITISVKENGDLAVFAYNFFSKTNAAVIAKFDTFAHDLHDFFATGSRVR